MKLEKEILKGIQDFLVTQGDHLGSPFKILPWQRRFLTEVFGNPDVTTAALTVSRGNGKSTFISAICALALNGALQKNRSDIIVCASSFSQGCVIGRHVLAFLGKQKHLRVVSNSQHFEIENKKSGVLMRVISSDPRRAHGLAPSLILLDEGAQWPPSSGDQMFTALRTSLGKVEGARLLAIGTRPSSELHWFSQMLAGGADVVADYSLPKDADVSQKRLWTKANPSLNHLPSLKKQLNKEFKEALKNPFAMANFKALRLNQGTDECLEDVVLSVSDWKLALVDKLPPREGLAVMGMDLGSSNSMTAISYFWTETGRLESLCFFPSMPDLKTRAQNDGAGSIYHKMQDRGELELIGGGRTIPYDKMLKRVFEKFGYPQIICCDRYKKAEAADSLDKTDCPRSCEIKYRGMGYYDGSIDVQHFRTAVLNEEVKTLNTIGMTTALQDSRVSTDPSGNVKICKSSSGRRRARAKDDVLVSTVLALAEGHRIKKRKLNRKPTKITII